MVLRSACRADGMCWNTQRALQSGVLCWQCGGAGLGSNWPAPSLELPFLCPHHPTPQTTTIANSTLALPAVSNFCDGDPLCSMPSTGEAVKRQTAETHCRCALAAARRPLSARRHAGTTACPLGHLLPSPLQNADLVQHLPMQTSPALVRSSLPALRWNQPSCSDPQTCRAPRGHAHAHMHPHALPLFADALVNQLNFPQTTCQLQCTDPQASGLSVPMLQLSNPPYWIANGLTADPLTTNVSSGSVLKRMRCFLHRTACLYASRRTALERGWHRGEFPSARMAEAPF